MLLCCSMSLQAGMFDSDCWRKLFLNSEQSLLVLERLDTGIFLHQFYIHNLRTTFSQCWSKQIYPQLLLSLLCLDYNLFSLQAIHKAMVDVRENGTEAAAVTLMRIMPMSLPFPPPPRITFNRPFLMMIIDKNTDGLLFLGKIVNPTAKED